MDLRPFTIAVLPLLVAMACAGSGEPSASPPGVGAATGETIYRTHCTLCHGNDGKLNLSGAKDLSVSVLTREEMIRQVSEGKGAMMAYKNVLTRKEIEAVVDHVRTLAATE